MKTDLFPHFYKQRLLLHFSSQLIFKKNYSITINTLEFTIIFKNGWISCSHVFQMRLEGISIRSSKRTEIKWQENVYINTLHRRNACFNAHYYQFVYIQPRNIDWQNKSGDERGQWRSELRWCKTRMEMFYRMKERDENTTKLLRCYTSILLCVNYMTKIRTKENVHNYYT